MFLHRGIIAGLFSAFLVQACGSGDPPAAPAAREQVGSNVQAISTCNASGVCKAGGAVGCNDGNSCTDDTCDPDSGACLGTIDDTNACSDGSACTAHASTRA
ncbi:MAG TPA: hypothetical protein VJN18_14085 [Polyangiaceae bacterium]|nr:hypothetical protein [Polyangiaceae bacterium]